MPVLTDDQLGETTRPPRMPGPALFVALMVVTLLYLLVGPLDVNFTIGGDPHYISRRSAAESRGFIPGGGFGESVVEVGPVAFVHGSLLRQITSSVRLYSQDPD